MVRKYKVIYSNRCQQDFHDILERIKFISKSPYLAESYVYEMQLYIYRTLEKMPDIFAVSEYAVVRQYGKYSIQFKGYTIIYNVEADAVVVEHIMPASMIIRGI